MSPEQWALIKNIFDEATSLPPGEQPDFVRASASGATEIESEVLRLLEAHASTNDFLEEPAAHLHDYLGSQIEEPCLEVGTIIAGRFKILSFLDRGGMGEVYEAWDADLNEAVALKTVRPSIASKAQVIERFKREVRHAREISHPNICRVHELFGHDLSPDQRMWLLSMELLPGVTLLERVRQDGPLPSTLALNIARQMISGLQAAHAVGLVHRDFKTSNVMLVPAPDGSTRAVITDFGLSLRLLKPEDGLSEPGGMGTPGYMAPEQQENGEVGPLADQFALGAVLCEMITGSLPCWSDPKGVPGKPTLHLPRRKFPPRWEGVLCKCLERDPGRRFAKIEDVWKCLAPPRRFTPALALAAALLLVVSLVAAFILRQRADARCRICDVVQLTPDTDESESPSVAAKGRAIVYSSDRSDAGNLDIFYQGLPAGRPLRLTTDPARDGDPSISPDGDTVVFRSERNGGGLYLTYTRGGIERLIVPHGRNPQISPDGRTLLYWTGDHDPGIASGKIFVMPLPAGESREIAGSFEDARFPVWSPDGKAILFSGCRTAEKPLPGCSEWWATSVDGSRLVNTRALDRINAAGLTLSRPGAGFWYDGGILFSGTKGARANLWRIELDPQTWTAEDGPKQLLQEEARDLSPSLARDGTLAYTRITGALHVWRAEHASDPGHATLSKLTEDTQIDGSPFVSPQGRWLIFERGRGSRPSFWVRDNIAPPERLLFTPGVATHSPILSDTGDLLAYEQVEGGTSSVYTRMRSDPPRRLCRGCSKPSGWFDGERAIFYRDGLPSEIKMGDPVTGTTRTILQEKGASLSEANWSPANQLMLFTETKGDRKRIFAVHLPTVSGVVDGKWIAIPDQGVSPDHPRWSGNGRTIFYTSNSDGFLCVYAQPFSPEQGTPAGPPFAVVHFHNQRASIENVFPRSFNLSVAGDSLYFNLGEQSSTIWTGSLGPR